jgi:hypothetical protein
MTRSTLFLAALSLLWLGGQATAGGTDIYSGPTSKQATTVGGPCGCSNDYCRKPMPCAPCGPQQWLCDDYCRKPMPCVTCPCAGGCPDDYCRKPCPDLCRPLDKQYYRCGPPDTPVAPCQSTRVLWR